MREPTPETPQDNKQRRAMGGHVDNATPVTLEDVAKRLAGLETAMEGLGQYNMFKTESLEYLRDMRSEVRALKTIRWVSVGFAAALVIMLMSAFVCAMFFDSSVTRQLGEYALGAFIISTVAGSIFVLSIVLKGSFRSISDRNKDDHMHPGIKMLAEMVGDANNTK